MKTFLFEYEFEGSEWGFSIEAADEDEARSRLAAMATGALQGQVAEVIPIRRQFRPAVVG